MEYSRRFAGDSDARYQVEAKQGENDQNGKRGIEQSP